MQGGGADRLYDAEEKNQLVTNRSPRAFSSSV